MKHTKTITTALILGLITFWGCEDTTGPEENNDLPEISSLTLEQEVSCSNRYGASAVAYNSDIYLIGGWYNIAGFGTFAHNSIEKLDNINHQWISLNNYGQFGRRYLTAEVINDVIYIIGGEEVAYQSTPAKLTNVVIAFNITTNSITQVDNLPTKRKQLNSVVFEDKIYVLGGELENTGERTGVLEVYDPSSDSWSTLTPMPTARECDVALIKDKIYAFGGYNGSTSLTTVEIYDIENDSWSAANDMPYDLSAYHLASFENFVFLFGDYSTHIDEVNMYNANDDSWIKLSTNFTGRRHAAVVRNDEWIYVIGGYSGGYGSDVVEKCKPYE